MGSFAGGETCTEDIKWSSSEQALGSASSPSEPAGGSPVPVQRPLSPRRPGCDLARALGRARKQDMP